MPAHQLLSSYCRVHQKNKSTPDDLKHRHIIVNDSAPSNLKKKPL